MHNKPQNKSNVKLWVDMFPPKRIAPQTKLESNYIRTKNRCNNIATQVTQSMTWRPKACRIPFRSQVKTENLKSQPAGFQYTCDRLTVSPASRSLTIVWLLSTYKRNSYRNKNRRTPAIAILRLQTYFRLSLDWLIKDDVTEIWLLVWVRKRCF